MVADKGPAGPAADLSVWGGAVTLEPTSHTLYTRNNPATDSSLSIPDNQP